jgi:hypothetical protein
MCSVAKSGQVIINDMGLQDKVIQMHCSAFGWSLCVTETKTHGIRGFKVIQIYFGSLNMAHLGLFT